MSSEGKTNPEISEQLKMSLPTAYRWRLRWSENSSSIIALENDHRENANRDLILIREINQSYQIVIEAALPVG